MAYRDGLPEEMISCFSCGRSGHPSCLQMQTAKLIKAVRSYAWKCIECKTCEACQVKGDDVRLSQRRLESSTRADNAYAALFYRQGFSSATTAIEDIIWTVWILSVILASVQSLPTTLADPSLFPLLHLAPHQATKGKLGLPSMPQNIQPLRQNSPQSFSSSRPARCRFSIQRKEAC